MCPEFFEEDGVRKLCHTVLDKEDYVIHHRTLKYVLEHGMILKSVNRAVLYTEEAWMKGYIEFCAEQRRRVELEKNDFLVDFWKLMMNSVFGKTMENIRKRINFELVNDNKRLQKLINKPTFQDISVYVSGPDKDADLGSQPIDRGMNEFVYDYCFPKWGIDNFRICPTDTDSAVCEMKTWDLYADIAPDIPEMFDTSNTREQILMIQ